MLYMEEIEHRNNIMSKIRNGERVTAEDRFWLVSHRIYDQFKGYPYLNMDIIQLKPNVDYQVRVQIKDIAYSERICPIITAPGGKGEILSNSPVLSKNGKLVPSKAVKSLCLTNKEVEHQTCVRYISSCGMLGVSFECEYFDEKQNLVIRKNSTYGDPRISMFAEVLSENKVLYRCKAPGNTDFTSFIFSLEWTPCN